ncbi:MAG: flagellin [Candidatus Auribacterota bacterium]
MFQSMFTRINSQIPSQSMLLTLSIINRQLVAAQERASTLKRINRASDGPSDYYSIRRLDKGISDNGAKISAYESSINYLEKNDGYLSQISSTLSEMSSLANQALDVSVTTAEKVAIQEDLNQLLQSIEGILSSGVAEKLYTGFSIGGLHNVSLEGTATDSAEPTLAGLTLDGTNVNVTGSVSDINQTITNIDNALDVILKDEARLGSYVKRIENDRDMLEIEQINQLSTKSLLEDADIAEVQLELAKLQIMQSASLALLAQSNLYYQNVLSLI